MKFLSRLLIASLTFVVGLSGTSWWHLLRHPESAVKVPSLSNSAINASGSIEETEEETEDGWAHEQGLYSNYEYGYSVIIPDGLTAYRSPAPMPQHGVGIDLFKEDEAQVWINGTYDSLEWGSLKEAAKENVKYLKDDNVSDIKVMRKTYGRLSSLRAFRIVAAYRKSGVPLIEDEIIAIRKERDIVYTLQLKTTAARYSEDVKVLNQLQRTFRLEALPYP
jgi:hypothetical protein